MLKIYGLHTPNFFKVLWTAEELKLNYEHVKTNLMKGETRTPEHMARHPFGKVPVIEHDGRFVFESNAIVRYLVNFSKSELYPAEVYEKAQTDQWLDYFTMQMGRWITNVWFEKEIAPKYFNRASDEKIVTEFTSYINEQMPILNEQLRDKTYLTGNKFSIADIVAASLTMGYEKTGIDFSKYPHFTKWFKQVSSRPAYLKLKDLSPLAE
jgi:glutathione S-transferase